MKYIDILSGFELEINQIDDQINKPKTEDSLYWLNQAVMKFCKTRFNKESTDSTSYEETEKRRIDLEQLYKTKTYSMLDFKKSSKQPDYDQYTIKYPKDFMFRLSEDTVICDKAYGHKKNVSVFECTKDSFMYRIMNHLTDFHYRYHNARPIRVTTSEGCNLLTDKNYLISEYTLGYLRYPEEINLDKPFDEYTDFPDIVITEIIKIAAQMYIASTFSEGHPYKYQMITNEVNTQE